MDCTEALRDARSTITFAAGAFLFLLWQTGTLQRKAVRWWKERPRRNMEKFRAEEAKRLTNID